MESLVVGNFYVTTSKSSSDFVKDIIIYTRIYIIIIGFAFKYIKWEEGPTIRSPIYSSPLLPTS